MPDDPWADVWAGLCAIVATAFGNVRQYALAARLKTLAPHQRGELDALVWVPVLSARGPRWQGIGSGNRAEHQMQFGTARKKPPTEVARLGRRLILLIGCLRVPKNLLDLCVYGNSGHGFDFPREARSLSNP